jgi:tartrate dehydrogenase/decarboxylase/D-malate dehydrogenase
MWAAAMMLEHLGEVEAGSTLVAAFEAALADGVRTADLGGTAGTSEFTEAVLAHCRSTSLNPRNRSETEARHA